MTQASVKGTLTATTESQSAATTYSASGSVDVAVGDVIYAIGRTTVGGTRSWSDNLGNTWSNFDTPYSRVYCRVTNAGTLTTITMTWSSGNTGVALINAVVFEGPFDSSPLGKNLAGSADTSDPYTSAATGTLSKATELVVGTYIYTRPNGSTLTATSPFAMASQVETGTGNSSLGAAVNYAKTNTTSALTPEFTTNIGVSAGQLYTHSFKFTPRRRPMSSRR